MKLNIIPLEEKIIDTVLYEAAHLDHNIIKDDCGNITKIKKEVSTDYSVKKHDKSVTKD